MSSVPSRVPGREACHAREAGGETDTEREVRLAALEYLDAARTAREAADPAERRALRARVVAKALALRKASHAAVEDLLK